MSRVFISYRRTEQAFAEKLRDQLRAWGFDTWMDIDQIAKGSYWPDEIDRGLNACEFIVGVMSPKAIESRNVKNEWDWAIANGKRLILLMYKKCNIPMNYVSINYIDFQNAAKKDFEALRVALETPPIPPSQHEPKVEEADQSPQTVRSQVIDQVQTNWIEGVLENAVGMGELDLAIANQPHAVLRHTDYDDYVLQPGTSIQAVFEKVGGELLILGNPGSGKTVALLQLARGLLHRAREDGSEPIPVVFNLSTWTPMITVVQNAKPKEVSISFDEWIVEYTSSIFSQLSGPMAREWLDKNAFILLLDGLDEVAEAKRDDCIHAINTFRKNPRYESVRMVICSRIQEYEELSTKVYLQAAIVLQPLTDQQIDARLQSDDLDELRALLRVDNVMREMARSAFLLFLMMRVYRNAHPGEIRCEGPPEERIRQLLSLYIESRFRERHSLYYRPRESLHYLTWLARKMAELSITIFDIGAINHLWLPEDKRDTYWTIAIGAGTVAGLASGAVLAAILRNPVGVVMGQVGKRVGGYTGSKYIMRELRKAGNIPEDYAHFLNIMTEIELMRKSGNQYMFIHRTLQEYLAALERNDEQQ